MLSSASQVVKDVGCGAAYGTDDTDAKARCLRIPAPKHFEDKRKATLSL